MWWPSLGFGGTAAVAFDECVMLGNHHQRVVQCSSNVETDVEVAAGARTTVMVVPGIAS